jgi:hypothetical protein
MPLVLSGDGITSDNITSLAASKLTGQVADANAPSGSVIQVVQTVKTNSFSSSSNGFVDITGLSATITPTSSSNKILVLVNITAGNQGNQIFNLLRNSTNICQSTSAVFNSTTNAGYFYTYSMFTIPISFLDSPSTTSAVTYKIQVDCQGVTSFINLRATDNYYGGTSSVTLMEIAA